MSLIRNLNDQQSQAYYKSRGAILALEPLLTSSFSQSQNF